VGEHAFDEEEHKKAIKDYYEKHLTLFPVEGEEDKMVN
jgi:hypothetical protein